MLRVVVCCIITLRVLIHSLGFGSRHHDAERRTTIRHDAGASVCDTGAVAALGPFHGRFDQLIGRTDGVDQAPVQCRSASMGRPVRAFQGRFQADRRAGVACRRRPG